MPTYCSTLSPKPLFCADFDEGLTLKQIWDNVTSGDGTATLVNGPLVFSPPDAMSVVLNTQAKNVDCAGYKQMPPLASPAVYTLTSEVMVQQADTTSNSDAVLLTLQIYDANAPTAGYWDLQLELDYDMNGPVVYLSQDVKPADGGTETYPGFKTGAAIPLNTWAKVGLVIATSNSGAMTGMLVLNDSQVASVAASITVPNPTPEIIVGTTYANSSATSWQVRYDNVTFTEE